MVLQISTLFLAFLMSLLATSGPVMGAAAGQTSAVSGSVFYLHYKSELYHSENASVILLEEANLSLPVSAFCIDRINHLRAFFADISLDGAT
jgi:hypothetical protein